MPSFVSLQIAIALVLSLQASSLRLHQDSVNKTLEGRYLVRQYLKIETKRELTTTNDDGKSDYLKGKSYEKEEKAATEGEDGDNERLGGGIEDLNGILPEFSIPIGNVTATLGRDARLICTVEHLGQYQVAWLKLETNTILSIDTNIITSNYRMFLIPDEEERKWVLHIKDVQVSDGGIYQCQVNTVPVRSIAGYLDVLVPPSIIESQTSQAVDVMEYSNATIQCMANGHPKVNISWRRDDGSPIKLKDIGGNKELELKSVIGIETQALNEISSETLSLQQVDRSMAGVYVCIASNGVTTQATKRIPLYVRFPPKTSVQKTIYTVTSGNVFEVDCTIEAFPKANNFWFKKVARAGKQVSAKRGERETIILPNKKSSKLVLASFPKLNHAFLSRQKRQSLSTSSLNTTASLNGLNSRDNQLQSSNVHLTYPDLEQTATIKSNRMKEFLGETEIVPIIESSTTIVRQTVINSYTYKLKLTFSKVTPEDYGEYICISSNSLGNSTINFALLRMPDEISKLFTTTTIDPRQKHLAESNNESSPYPQDMKVVLKSGKLVDQKTSLRRNGNHVYDENYLQTIKSRQRNGSRGVKLRHRGYKNSAANSISISIFYLLTLTSATILLL